MSFIKSILIAIVICLCVTNCETRTDISTSVVKDFVPRNYYGAKLEPVTKVLHGAGQCYWNNSVQEYLQMLQGKYDPVIINDYITVRVLKKGTDAFIHNIRNWLAKFPSYTMFQLGLALGAPEKEGGPFKDLTENVASGAYDDTLNYLFNALNTLNVPVYIRIGYECNGSWNHYATDSYKRAYRHVTNLLRSSILNNNSASIWCIASDGSSAYMDWYPGDQFVDWWAIDLFRATGLTSNLTKSFLSDADQHQKPVMIGESSASYTGVSGGQASWDNWFEPYFELIRNNPGIKAFNYINWEWDSKRRQGWRDSRIGKNGLVAALYAHEMASPLFLHASTKETVMDSLKSAEPEGSVIR
ncbi:glycoside hydrolase family 26 protein [Thermodesulfobacteriota bacterium]